MNLSPKAEAWELLGERYWNSGYYGGPADEHRERFGRLLRPGVRVAVVGATTVSLSKAALEAGSDLHLLDFTPGMLRAAARWLSLKEDRCHLVDVTRPVPVNLRHAYDVVLADRLINRFSAADLRNGLRGLRDLLTSRGQLAATARFGLYPRDEELHASLTPKEQAKFWRTEAGEVDYSALPERDLPFPKWGDIGADRIARHMRARGREVRLSADELLNVAAQERLACVEAIDATDGTVLLVLERTRA